MRTQSTAIKLFQGSLFLFMGLCLAASSRADGLAPGTLNVVTVDLQGQNPGNGDIATFVIDSPGALFSYLVFNPISSALAGRYDGIYRIAVNNRMVLPSAAPHLTTQPNPAIAYVGQTHTFSVQSDKPQNVNYVWWKNGAMRGPGTSELVLANLTSQDSGWYRVMASNSSGTVVSDSVYLEVREGQPTGAEENPETPPVSANEENIGTAEIHWTAPTLRTDGTPLQPSDIKGYRVYQGSESRGWYRYHQVNDPNLNFVDIEGLAPDAYYFAISVIDQFGQESDPSELAYKTITAPAPISGS